MIFEMRTLQHPRSGDFLAPSCDNEPCSFQLVLNVELSQEVARGAKVAEIVAVCRGTENCSMEEGLEVLSVPATAREASKRSLRPGVVKFADLPQRSQFFELSEDTSDLPINITLVLEFGDYSDLEPLVNLSASLRILLLPMQAWDVPSCEVGGFAKCSPKVWGVVMHRYSLRPKHGDRTLN